MQFNKFCCFQKDFVENILVSFPGILITSADSWLAFAENCMASVGSWRQLLGFGCYLLSSGWHLLAVVCQLLGIEWHLLTVRRNSWELDSTCCHLVAIFWMLDGRCWELAGIYL